MSVPNYADIGGPAETNGNRHYKIFVGPDSTGRPGIWHVYFDGAKEFLVSPAAAPPDAMGGGATNSMQTSAAGAIAAAPPVQSNGGVEAPAAASPATATPEPAAISSHPQKPNNDFNWQFNEQKNAWYYEQLHQATDGSAGFIHHYADGTMEYVAKTPPNGSANGINSSDAMQTAPGGLPAFNSSQSSGGDGHDTATVEGSSSSIGAVNNADGLHGATGFSGHASELHSSTPDLPAAVQATPAPAVASDASPVAALETVTPVAASVAPPADASHTYNVVVGDNMWDIAQKHNMTLEQLTALNPQIEHPELILPGQQLNLGNGEPAAVASTDGAASFPTTSSYDSTTTQAQTAEAHKVSLGGWSDGTGSVPHDPTHGIAAVAQANTDPLKINDNKPDSA
jgi:LysM repeat protein